MASAELMEAWSGHQEARRLAPSTIRRRGVAVRSWIRFIAPTEAGEATVEDVEEWLRSLHNPETRWAYLSDVRQFYRWARRRRLVRIDPTEDVDAVRRPKGLPRPIPMEAVRLALGTARVRTQTMVMLGAFAGLRVSEIANLRWEDVSLNTNPPVLVVRHGKGDKDRVVPVHPELRVHLRAIERSAGPVIESWQEPGEHVKPDQVTRTITRLFRLAGISATPHALRHTFVTEAVRASGGRLVGPGKMAGHESYSTTERYNGWSPDLAEIVNAMYV